MRASARSIPALCIAERPSNRTNDFGLPRTTFSRTFTGPKHDQGNFVAGSEFAKSEIKIVQAADFPVAQPDEAVAPFTPPRSRTSETTPEIEYPSPSLLKSGMLPK